MSTVKKHPIGDWLNLCPVGVLALDRTGSICWVNPALEALLKKEAVSLIGLNPKDPALGDLAPLFGGNGLAHFVADGEERWLECETREARDTDDSAVTLIFCSDASDRERLKNKCRRLERRVEELTIVDKLTGLSNKRALLHALNNHVTRSRRYNNALSLGVIRISGATTATQDSISDAVILAVSHFLRDRLRWADNIGRYDETTFVLILPESDITAAANLVDKIERESREIDLLRELSLTLFFGIAEWRKGNDARLLLARAFEAMEESRSEAASLT